MTTICITIQSTFLAREDPDASMAFGSDALGFEIRTAMIFLSTDACVEYVQPFEDRPYAHPATTSA